MNIWKNIREYLQWCDFIRALGAKCKPPIQLETTVIDENAQDQCTALGVSLDRLQEAFQQYYNTGVYSDPAICNWSNVINLSIQQNEQIQI